jgi:copper oxidase (laccase) domain-containing protein
MSADNFINNLDIAMVLTDAILNEFEKDGRCNIPTDEYKYSFDLQDVIQDKLNEIGITGYKIAKKGDK